MKYKDIHELSYELMEQVRRRYKRHGVLKEKLDPDAPLFDFERVYRVMRGAIDTHVHPGPDDIDIATKLARWG